MNLSLASYILMNLYVDNYTWVFTRGLVYVYFQALSVEATPH